jgi:hypothetical protein
MALYELQNIQWELDPPEDNPEATYEEMLALYELPTSCIVRCDDEEGIADALSNKFGWLVQDFEIAPDLQIEQHYTYCISQSLAELCEDLEITRDQIESARVKWTRIYLTLKDGRELEYETYGDPSEIDYKYPEKVVMWDIASGTTWSGKGDEVPMSENDHKLPQKYVLTGRATTIFENTQVLGIYRYMSDAESAGAEWLQRLGDVPASYYVTCTEDHS